MAPADGSHNDYSEALVPCVGDGGLVGSVHEVILGKQGFEIPGVNDRDHVLRFVVEGKGDMPDKALLFRPERRFHGPGAYVDLRSERFQGYAPHMIEIDVVRAEFRE